MNKSEKKVRVRIAPSPTGFMHIGNFRTALYNFLFAKKLGGDFVLRIEDTDRKRFVPGAMESLLNSLEWAGIECDEGPCNKKQETINKKQNVQESLSYPGIIEVGEFGPYIQSERLELYKKYADQLVSNGKAYYCFCEPERIEKVREQQIKEKIAPHYDRYCLNNISPDQINEKLKEKCSYTIRLKVPENEIIEFDDIVHKKVSFNSNNIDDQILFKSDGFPTYHLANVVDDHLMEITHVIRGEEWLPSTPKHVLLYRAFGWEAPKFAHMPLLLNANRSKLSKRQGDVAVEDYVAKGYLKEALINFVALLGWNEGKGSTQEIFSIDELIQKFELEKVHKAGAVFDLKKLDWINGQYIKKLSDEELLNHARPFFEKQDFYVNASDDKKTDAYLSKVLTVEKERLAKFSDVGIENRFFFENISFEKGMLAWKTNTTEQTIESLKSAQEVFEKISDQDWTLKMIEEKLLEAADKPARNATHSVAGGRGDLLWPLRVALTGAQKSPSPFECAWVLGKNESIKRLENAIKML